MVFPLLACVLVQWLGEGSRHADNSVIDIRTLGSWVLQACRVMQERRPARAGGFWPLLQLLESRSYAKAARIGGTDRQTLRDWVYRFNASGPDGIRDNWAAGPVQRLSAAQKAELSSLVEAGPDPAADRVVRWRRVDLKRVIKKRLG